MVETVILGYWGIHNIKTFTFHFNWTRWTMDRRVKVLLIMEKLVSLMHFPQPHISVGTAVRLELQPMSGFFFYFLF